MKNIKFLYPLLFFFVFSFIACSNDDDKDVTTSSSSDNAPTIEGIWQLDIIEEECGTYTVFDQGMAIIFTIGDNAAILLRTELFIRLDC